MTENIQTCSPATNTMVTIKEGRGSNKTRKYGNVLDTGNIITSYSSKVLRAAVLLMPGKVGLAVPACQQCKQPTLSSLCSFSELLEGREWRAPTDRQKQLGLSPFHFFRSLASVGWATTHKYLHYWKQFLKVYNMKLLTF